MELFGKIAAELAKQLEIPEERITPESRLVEDLHADSLDIIMLTMELEKAYSIQVPEEDILDVHTVADVVSYIEKYVRT